MTAAEGVACDIGCRVAPRAPEPRRTRGAILKESKISLTLGIEPELENIGMGEISELKIPGAFEPAPGEAIDRVGFRVHRIEPRQGPSLFNSTPGGPDH